MRIGVPTEIKSDEFRVGLVPGSVRELTARGHEVFVQSGAGAGILPRLPLRCRSWTMDPRIARCGAAPADRTSWWSAPRARTGR